MYQIDSAAYRGGFSEGRGAAARPEADGIKMLARYLPYLCFSGGEAVCLICAVISRTAARISDISVLSSVKKKMSI